MKNRRLTLKIAGQSGQGIDTLGKIISECCIKTGKFVVGYREYPSLIKGGNATFQIDISNTPIYSTSKTCEILFILNEQETKWYEKDLIKNAIVINNLKITIPENINEMYKDLSIKLLNIDTDKILQETHASPQMASIALISILVNFEILDLNILLEVIEEHFKSKGDTIIELNKNVVTYSVKSFKTNPEYNLKYDFNKIIHIEGINSLLTGNESISYGAIEANIKQYFAYPMTPSSSILSTLANLSDKHDINVLQVDDEISAVAMCLGSNLVGVRALTATSGGGFDLMSEHISLSMISEIPLVLVLAQRPGPATGLPTWTSQGDLLISVFAGHGEGCRIVIAVSDIYDCHTLIQTAFNLSENYKVPIILLTDKYLAESIFTKENDFEKVLISPIVNQNLFTNFNYNSDEHDEHGNVDESSENAIKMSNYRLTKESDILKQMPSPIVINNGVLNPIQSIKICSWGSNKLAILDFMDEMIDRKVSVEYLHLTFLNPLKIEEHLNFISQCTIIENNATAQLAKLISMKYQIKPKNTYLKYDGRPIFKEDLLEYFHQSVT